LRLAFLELVPLRELELLRELDRLEVLREDELLRVLRLEDFFFELDFFLAGTYPSFARRFSAALENSANCTAMARLEPLTVPSGEIKY